MCFFVYSSFLTEVRPTTASELRKSSEIGLEIWLRLGLCLSRSWEMCIYRCLWQDVSVSHTTWCSKALLVECVWNVMAHAPKPDFVFRRNGRVHLNRRGCQFSRLLAAEVCASAVVILDTPCSEVVWRVLATHSIHQFSLHFPSRASPCAITFQLGSTYI